MDYRLKKTREKINRRLAKLYNLETRKYKREIRWIGKEQHPASNAGKRNGRTKRAGTNNAGSSEMLYRTKSKLTRTTL